MCSEKELQRQVVIQINHERLRLRIYCIGQVSESQGKGRLYDRDEYNKIEHMTRQGSIKLRGGVLKHASHIICARYTSPNPCVCVVLNAVANSKVDGIQRVRGLLSHRRSL